MHDFGSHELQDRRDTCCQFSVSVSVMGRAAEHEGQCASAGTHYAAGHRGIDEAAGGGGVDGVGDFGRGGGVDGGAVDEEAVSFGAEGFRGYGREAGVEDVAENGCDVGRLGEDSDDDVLWIASCQRINRRRL